MEVVQCFTGISRLLCFIGVNSLHSCCVLKAEILFDHTFLEEWERDDNVASSISATNQKEHRLMNKSWLNVFKNHLKGKSAHYSHIQQK